MQIFNGTITKLDSYALCDYCL